MGRRRPKFSFPIPGRRTAAKTNIDDDVVSTPSISVAEWSPHSHSHLDSPSYSISKAQRILGTSGLPIRPSSRSQSSVPQSPTTPGYMTITVSEASFGSDYTDRASLAAMDDGGYYRPAMVPRPSSNLLGNVYNADGRGGSNSSSVSRHLHPKTSNSTMRSYYDPQRSPPSISQQTSASAVRDMALRKGRPPVASPREYDSHPDLPMSHAELDHRKREPRKGKPARLDLSKLFPKPRSNTGSERPGVLLSPNKLVNSPSAMSTASEYFPRPMTREPTPTPNAPRPQAKLTKSSKRQQAPAAQPPRPISPVRLHKRDEYDSAKINVRRPPRGIQHWFDAVGESSDEDYNEPEPVREPVRGPVPAVSRGPPLAPVRKSSLGRLVPEHDTHPRKALTPQYGGRKEAYGQTKPSYTHANQTLAHHLNSPSQYSLSSTKTKESALSKSNLQDSSVLSFSSSEDDEEIRAPKTRKYELRDSIDIGEDQEGDIVIGKAHAFEMRPRHMSRAPSESKMSMLSTSTNAATIEVMYTPEPYTTHFTVPKGYGSRRSSHIRQPSVIPEDVDPHRPKTTENVPMSPAVSLQSSRTSRSEPRSRSEHHKMMAVTEEEEALLEMMRRKRAAMKEQSFTEGFETAIRRKTPPETTDLRTSAFLTMDSPHIAPVKARTPSKLSVAGSASSLLLSPPTSNRGRTSKAPQDSTVDMSILRDNSSRESSTADFGRSISPSSRASHVYNPSTALKIQPLSPLDPFPSPAPTPTVASPTTTDHCSPLPSPVTPGMRHSDVDVQVAGSEPSFDGEDEVAITSNGVIEPPSGSLKTMQDSQHQHQRRRTASSGADVSFTPSRNGSPLPPMPNSTPVASVSGSFDLAPVSEASTAAPSILEQPSLPRKSSRRISNVAGSSRSRHSSRTSSPALGKEQDRRSSRVPSVASRTSTMRESIVGAPISASTRCSVSEEVLAAYGSLGGWRDFDTGKVGGM